MLLLPAAALKLDTAEVYRIADSIAAVPNRLSGSGYPPAPACAKKWCWHPKGPDSGYYGKPYRDNVVITPEAVHHSISDSLARLHTDYLDVWMFHRDSPRVAGRPAC